MRVESPGARNLSPGGRGAESQTPETHWLGPNPKNSQWTHPDPATVTDTFRGCTVGCSDMDTFTASVSRRNTVARSTPKCVHTQPHAQSNTRVPHGPSAASSLPRAAGSVRRLAHLDSFPISTLTGPHKPPAFNDILSLLVFFLFLEHATLLLSLKCHFPRFPYGCLLLIIHFSLHMSTLKKDLP